MGELQIHNNTALSKVEIVAQKRLIQEVMEAVMKDGTHYGTIPGCKQPSLYKPGSECILSTFRIAVDPQVEDLSGPDYYRYRVTVRGIIPTGEIVGAGVGECSTDEEKYKWRGAVCDEEFEATPEDRRRILWKKADKFHKTNYQVKQVRTNPADLANTVLKMAKKRGQIDLTLTATGASDVFAQDLEDLPEEVRDELTKDEQKPPGGKPEVKPPQSKKLTETQTEYFPRIKTALDTIHGANFEAKKATIKQATFIPESDKYPAKEGVEDYRTLDGKRLEILAHKLEKLADKAVDIQEVQPLPEICAECGEPFINGACRSISCPEGRSEDESA